MGCENLLDLLSRMCLVVFGEERDGQSGFARSPSTPDTVDVVFDSKRELESALAG